MYGLDEKSYNPLPTHGERVEARQRERAEGLKREAEAQETRNREQAAARDRAADEFLLSLLLALATSAKEEPPALQAPPPSVSPFMAFWRKTNAALTLAGQPQLHYGEAQRLFRSESVKGQPLTYCGVYGVNVRALPTDGGYHAEYFDTATKSWRRASTGKPYATAEGALAVARARRRS